MKRLLGFTVVVLMLLTLSSCGKKQEAEELQPITLETLNTATGTVTPSVDVKAQEIKALTASSTQTKEVIPVLPQGPYKPTNIEIQTALKNAGFYTGNIDGKIGPKSKKAIEDFQTANGLKVDGKVGPKTWESLSKHLTAMVAEPVSR